MDLTEFKPVRRYAFNRKGTDFCTGDIHGAFSKLQEKLDEIGFDETKDRLFCVADMIDRGPESHLFLDWLEKPWFHSVIGNHEELLIGNYENNLGMYRCHMQNGGEWFENTLLVTQEDRERMYNACRKLPYAIEIECAYGNVGIIHADTGKYTVWEEFLDALERDIHGARAACTWGRTRHEYKIETPVIGVYNIFVGHTPARDVREYGNVVYIDTGACFDNGAFTIVAIDHE